MRDASRFAALGLTVAGTLALALTATGNPTGTTTTTNSAGTTTTTNAATPTHSSGGSGLLCAGLLESGILADVFAVASAPATHHQDPGSAVQFAPIWSDSHQATVGNDTPAEPPKIKPAVATIKLPISFSEADKQKFAAAGWRPHTSGAAGMSYCLDRTQGMICVTAAP